MSTSVHWGDTMSTSGDIMSMSGDVQYIPIMMHVGVHRGMFSTSGDTMSTSGGYHEYIGDIMSTLGNVQYIRRCSVHRGFQ